MKNMEKWYNKKIEEIEQKLETNKEKGITTEEVQKRKEKYEVKSGERD